jgi:4-diphosphocytidyl-2-C-methyl-D-erythritol kinase
VIEPAPGKINLSLLLGPSRADGRHELVSVIQSITLADRLTLRDGAGEADEVRCPGVEGPNLAAAALAAFRAATGWAGPPQLLEIEKHVPVAGGMGGGSGDAAAALRMIARRAAIEDEQLLYELAAGLGADVPSQLQPGRVLATGAGERVRRLPDPEPFGVLVLPSHARLSTAAVYAQADRMGLPRRELPALVDDELPLLNELAPAACALEPSIERALDEARAAGAHTALVSGSGPTVVGLFERPEQAQAAAASLADRDPPAIAARPLVAHVRHN